MSTSRAKLVCAAMLGATLLFPMATVANAEGVDIPSEATHLGQPLQDVSLVGGEAAMDPDGVPRIWSAVSGEPARLIAVHALTGEVLFNQELPGSSSSYSVIVAENGDVYTSTNTNGHLYRLAWGSEEIEDLGLVAEGQTFAWDITEGDDGRIYGSTFPGAELYAFDPETGEFQQYGQITDVTQQGRTVGAVGDKVYFGTMDPGELFEVDIDTGEATAIPLPEGAAGDDGRVSLYDINEVDGKLYVRMGTDIKWAPLYEYDPATGEWGNSIDQVAGLELPGAGPDGELYVMRDMALTAWDPASGEFEETSLRYEGRVHNYRGVGWVDLGDPEWPGQTLVGFFWRGEMWRYNPATGKSELTQLQLPGEPIDILSLEGEPGGDIWAGGYLGGFGLVDAESGDVEFNRFSQTEVMVEHEGKLLVGAYPDARGYVYDPSLPLNDPDYAPNPDGGETNPVKLWDAKDHDGLAQDRVFALTAMDGKVYGALGPKGAAYGGALAISDLVSGETEFVHGIAEGRALTSLAAEDGILYAGTWIFGGTGASATEPPQSEGTVLAYDVASGEVLWETVPVAGVRTVTGATLDDDGRLWVQADGTLLEIDRETGEPVTVVALTEVGHMDSATWPFTGRGVQFDETTGMLYVSIGQQLFRVDPDTGDHELLGAFPYRIFTVLADGRIAMSEGGDLYVWEPPAPEGADEPGDPDPSEPTDPEPSEPGKDKPGLPSTGV